jgi:hypothetical protein
MQGPAFAGGVVAVIVAVAVAVVALGSITLGGWFLRNSFRLSSLMVFL